MPDFTTSDWEQLAKANVSNKPEDPLGEHPDVQYLFKENVNTQAKGEERNSLDLTNSSIHSSTIPSVGSIYPFNQVSRSFTGHVYEVDDTPGNERVLIKHANGAGIELAPDGSLTINSIKNKIEITGGEQSITVIGDAKMVYKGNLDLKVTGEYNIECNEFNLNVKNNKTETIGGSETKEVYKGSTTSVVGNSVSYVTGADVTTILAGQTYNVKGPIQYNVEGSMAFFTSAEMNITSEDYINMSSDNFTASANKMTVQGANGVIGGDSVHIKGQEASFEGSVEAPTFYGNLIGKAKFAALADKATGASTAGSIGASGTASYPSDPGEPSFVAPTSSKVSGYLTKTAGGIRKVTIDTGDYIKNFLDRAKRYSGISNQQMDTEKARSKMRDLANSTNSNFVMSLIEEGVINDQFNVPSPPAVGRVEPATSTTIQAKNPADAIRVTNNAVHIPKIAVRQFLPDPLYNPMFTVHPDRLVEASTKLSDNISVSRFLGSNDAVNIKHIRTRSAGIEIAKHLYLQTIAIKTIQEAGDELEGVTLDVTEGLYRPGPGEKITPKSINDLKSKGRAVVYKVIGADGSENNKKLFDVAVYLKDNISYDEIILAYDTLNPNKEIQGRIIITMPQLDSEYRGEFRRIVSTSFNNNTLSKNEFIEVIEKKVQRDPLLDSIDSSKWLIFKSGLSEFQKDIDNKLKNILVLIAQEFGEPLTITEGRRAINADYGAKNSQHKQGLAVDIRTNFSDAETVRLIDIAAKRGIRGIGIYRTSSRGGNNQSNSVHFDIRDGSKAAWGSDRNKGTFTKTELRRYPWAHAVLRKNGFPTG